MKSIAILLAGAAALAFSAPVLAADLPDTPPMVDDVASSSGWDGAYIGGYVDNFAGAVTSVGGEFGYNFTPAEAFLIGIQVSASTSVFPGFGFGQAYIVGKLGFGSDNFAVYGLGGIGFTTAFGPTEKLGAGVEFKFNDNWSIDGELAVIAPLGVPPLGGPLVGQVGVRYHF